jgi:hypothetical protein
MVKAKCGNKVSMRKLWNIYRRRFGQGDESALSFIRKIEVFDPGKVINRAGWKFSELFAGVTA